MLTNLTTLYALFHMLKYLSFNLILICFTAKFQKVYCDSENLSYNPYGQKNWQSIGYMGWTGFKCKSWKVKNRNNNNKNAPKNLHITMIAFWNKSEIWIPAVAGKVQTIRLPRAEWWKP